MQDGDNDGGQDNRPPNINLPGRGGNLNLDLNQVNSPRSDEAEAGNYNEDKYEPQDDDNYEDGAFNLEEVDMQEQMRLYEQLQANRTGGAVPAQGGQQADDQPVHQPRDENYGMHQEDVEMAD